MNRPKFYTIRVIDQETLKTVRKDTVLGSHERDLRISEIKLWMRTKPRTQHLTIQAFSSEYKQPSPYS